MILMVMSIATSLYQSVNICGSHGDTIQRLSTWTKCRSYIEYWLVVDKTHLKNMKVNWDDYSQYVEKCSKPPTRNYGKYGLNKWMQNDEHLGKIMMDPYGNEWNMYDCVTMKNHSPKTAFYSKSWWYRLFQTMDTKNDVLWPPIPSLQG